MMSIARKLLLLCATGLTAMAFGASTASAAPVEVVTEPGGEHCNPCWIHVEGESNLSVVSSGAIISSCEDEFEAEIYEDGHGWVHSYTNVDHTPIPPGCTREICDGTPESVHEREWPFQLSESVAGVEKLRIRFCLDAKAQEPIGPGPHCNVDIDVTEQATNNHHYIFSAIDELCFNDAVLLDGAWESEEGTLDPPHEDVEIIHPAP